jgi:tetratricopeptide (TPR) repeat protein
LDPTNGARHNTLGAALRDRKQDADAAIREFRRAIELNPKYSEPYANLGIALHDKQDWNGAVAALKQASALEPKRGDFLFTLGVVLRAKRDLDGAIDAYRRSIALDPANPSPYCNLAEALSDRGRFDEALTLLGRCRELAARNKSWPYHQNVADAFRRVQRMVELDRRLPAVLTGALRATDREERLEFARLCTAKSLPLAAARLYEGVLDSYPEQANRTPPPFIYDAACAAALAAVSGTGPPDRQETSGRTEKPLTDADRAKFRNQARAWLEAVLKVWSGLLESAKGHKQRQAIAGTLEHWREDTDLVSVRDKLALDRLPEGERAMWKTLWADVDRLLKKAVTP